MSKLVFKNMPEEGCCFELDGRYHEMLSQVAVRFEGSGCKEKSERFAFWLNSSLIKWMKGREEEIENFNDFIRHKYIDEVNMCTYCLFRDDWGLEYFHIFENSSKEIHLMIDKDEYIYLLVHIGDLDMVEKICEKYGGLNLE